MKAIVYVVDGVVTRIRGVEPGKKWKRDDRGHAGVPLTSPPLTAVDAGIAARPHDLRHTLGTLLPEQGYDLAVIAEILGHASVETTGRYTLVSGDEAVDALKASPSRSESPSRPRSRLPIRPR
ncbi:tyrosine-type recombinase/integrase [Amycolatopsis sp. cmx-4-54]|uniref:tyrosine-type recombinase/integrase n=1 Tax=Amycolatopsis sp. cmx-4-54 TaxID=2790936 RepID=UPI00397D3A0D